MRPNPWFPADLVTFTEEIINGKLHFLCSVLKKSFAVYIILDHSITLKILEFILNSAEKVKPYFFTFLNVYVSWIQWDKILISQLSPAKFRYFADQNGTKWGLHENEFRQFLNVKNEFPKKLGLKKQIK